LAASVIRDDAPWLYEIAMEAYRAVKADDPAGIEREMGRIHRFSEFMMRGPFMEEFAMGSKDAHMFCMEFPRMLERMLERALAERKGLQRRRSLRLPHEQQ
jgi:hypothetical protein